jgi:hypothetical protein
MLSDRADAYQLLKALGAPERLLTHVQLVGEAADQLLACYTKLKISLDRNLVILGVAVHDAGKIQFPQELDGPGSLHEAAGELLLLANGVQPQVAKCCVSHAAWRDTLVGFEELSVALADKLWKGKREPDLELKVIDEAAKRLGASRWAVFEALDTAFESIAAAGEERLARS